MNFGGMSIKGSHYFWVGVLLLLCGAVRAEGFNPDPFLVPAYVKARALMGDLTKISAGELSKYSQALRVARTDLWVHGQKIVLSDGFNKAWSDRLYRWTAGNLLGVAKEQGRRRRARGGRAFGRAVGDSVFDGAHGSTGYSRNPAKSDDDGISYIDFDLFPAGH